MSKRISISFHPGALRLELEDAFVMVPFRHPAALQKDSIAQTRAIGHLAEEYRYRLNLSEEECFSILHQFAVIGEQLAQLLFVNDSWPIVKEWLRARPAIDIEVPNFNYMWIPWEIFYIGHHLQYPKYQDFCGYQRTIFRVADENENSTTLTSRPKWGFLPFSGWSRDSIMSEVKDQEEASCVHLSDKLIRKEFSPLNPQVERKLEIKRLRQYLEHVNIIHFSCLINSVFEKSLLLLDSSFWLSIEDLTKRMPDDIVFEFNGSPLVVFNVRDNYTRNPLHVLQYVQMFHRLKALGVITSTLPIPNYLAAQFTGQFYKNLLQEEQLIGQALAETKRYFMDQLNNPFALFYMPYLSPASKMINSSHMVEADSQGARDKHSMSSPIANELNGDDVSITGEKMTKLSHNDRRRLSDELNQLPDWVDGDKIGEKGVLREVGLPHRWINRLRLTGTPITDATTVITSLEGHGHLIERPTYLALGALVEYLLNETIHVEGKLFLAHLIDHYQLITNLDYLEQLGQKYALLGRPPSGSLLDLGWQIKQPDFVWQGPTSPSELEAIWGKKAPFLDAVFLEKGAKVARSVCRVEVEDVEGIDQTAYGTGFLIAPNLVLTNDHVVPTDEEAKSTQVRFGYRIDRSGQLQQGEIYQVKQALRRSPIEELDYVVLELEDSPGAKDEIGYLKRVAATLKKNQSAYIIQHPNAEPQKVVLQENWITYVANDQRRVQYLTNTKRGSSGSPVCNQKWEVVALHHSGGPIPSSVSNISVSGNEGIPMAAIWPEIEDLLP